MEPLAWYMTVLLTGFDKIRYALQRVWLSCVRTWTPTDDSSDPVLLAYASHDATISSEEAFDLSNRPQMHIRLDAIWALGRVVPTEDERLLTRALDRFDEVIEAPGSDNDAAHAIEAALHLLHRTDGKILQCVEPLLVKACTTPAPETVYTLAFGLQTRRNIYSQAMIDAIFPLFNTLVSRIYA